MELVISYLAVIAVSVVSALLPVKLAASKLRTPNSGWLYAVIAVTFSLMIIFTATNIIPITYVAVPVAIGLVGFIYESVFDTTLKKGLYIAFFAVLIQFVVLSIMLKIAFS